MCVGGSEGRGPGGSGQGAVGGELGRTAREDPMRMGPLQGGGLGLGSEVGGGSERRPEGAQGRGKASGHRAEVWIWS